jgi:hypothetical protein
MVGMSDVEASAIEALIGNDQLTCALAVPLGYLLRDRYSPIRLLAKASLDRWIAPFSNGWHPSLLVTAYGSSRISLSA